MLLFAYGTLMYGLRAHNLLVGSLFAGRGSTRGALYLCDGYPLLVAEGEGRVWGELYHVDEPSLSRIEWYEGVSSPSSPWKRLSVTVDVLGLRVDAFAYGAPSLRVAEELCSELQGPYEHGDYRLLVRGGPPRWLVATPPGVRPPGLPLGGGVVRVEGFGVVGGCLAPAAGGVELEAHDVLARLEDLEEWAGGLGCRLGGVRGESRGFSVYPVAPLGARG